MHRAQRLSAAQDQRKRGTRIKFGLDELGNLDAPQAPNKTTAKTFYKASVLPDGGTPIMGKACSRTSSAGVFGTWLHWQRVKDLLFPAIREGRDRSEDLAAARCLVNLWKLRSRPALRTADAAAAAITAPPYVESTLMLLEAQRLDQIAFGGENMTFYAGQGGFLGGLVAPQYSAAVLRVVHMMTSDLVTAKSFRDEQTTYRTRARQIGFPEEAVEVRQRIAHGSSPGLEELRWVSSLLLEFLYLHFWLPQSQHTGALVAAEDAEAADAERRLAKRRRKELQRKNCNVSQAEILSLLDELEASSNDNGEAVEDQLPCKMTAAGWLIEIGG
jgi:ribosomal biogenesis protein LAS1